MLVTGARFAVAAAASWATRRSPSFFMENYHHAVRGWPAWKQMKDGAKTVKDANDMPAAAFADVDAAVASRALR
eukprot:8860290-Pyramimonas_sp.AAC.1